MSKKPYLIDAVVGNSKLLATLDKTGQIHRLWWPRIDTPQHVNQHFTGVQVAGKTSWLHDSSWSHEQLYINDTAILKTVAFSSELGLEVVFEDIAAPNSDLYVRQVTITNKMTQAQKVAFVQYADLHMGETTLYNTNFYDQTQDAIVHYQKQFAVAIGACRGVSKYQTGATLESVEQATLNGNYIDMGTKSGMAWDLGLVAPGETVELSLYLAFGNTSDEALTNLGEYRKVGYEQIRENTIDYWKDFLAQARPVHTGNEMIDRLYRRSLIVFKLMTDDANGSLIAAPEFDEYFTRCGGYAYCWGRDAAYITTAVDRAGYHHMGKDFYRWTVRAQSADGSWAQRHYLDGSLAPQWGLQIDETGSILWGMWQHYVITQDKEFVDEIWDSVKKGAEFLVGFIDPETGLPLPSRDLWEEREAEHTYSAAAVYGGLIGAAEMARVLGHESLVDAWTEEARKIQEAAEKQLWNDEKQSYLRGIKLSVSKEQMEEAKQAGKNAYIIEREKGYQTHIVHEDPIVDVSLLGVNMPFEMVSIDSERMAKTADAVEQLLTSPKVKGIKRYEDDHYIGGNPWILTTLWLSMFRIKQGRIDSALDQLKWVLKYRTSLDLLPEQIDRETGETAWVVPLTWSHAMYVLTILDLVEKGVDLTNVTV